LLDSLRGRLALGVAALAESAAGSCAGAWGEGDREKEEGGGGGMALAKGSSSRGRLASGSRGSSMSSGVDAASQKLIRFAVKHVRNAVCRV
jgi:hypothetical protein